jgi:hypothetical protein
VVDAAAAASGSTLTDAERRLFLLGLCEPLDISYHSFPVDCDLCEDPSTKKLQLIEASHGASLIIDDRCL